MGIISQMDIFSASIEFFSPFDLIADWITIKFLQETNNVFSNEVLQNS